jgi:hypothetical protein
VSRSSGTARIHGCGDTTAGRQLVDDDVPALDLRRHSSVRWQRLRETCVYLVPTAQSRISCTMARIKTAVMTPPIR